ncbi:MAG: PTS sugar transporter subunit IIB, partial [Myxococcales bacterium]
MALVRVDNRLVHGQVLEAWVPALSVQAILVADDEVAGNALARAAMGLAI